MANAKYCPTCKERNVLGNDNYCYKDGTKLKEVPICSCGNVLFDFYKFCPKCGADVKHNINNQEIN